MPPVIFLPYFIIYLPCTDLFFNILQIYSKESKHRSDSLDETSQFSDLDDQMGLSPAHRPLDKQIDEEKISEEKITRVTHESSRETLEFLKFETEHSAQVHASSLTANESEKVNKNVLYD